MQPRDSDWTHSRPSRPAGVFVERWAQSHGSPYLIADDDESADADVALVEDAEVTAHAGAASSSLEQLAFIDGVRRGEASLYQIVDGRFVRGIAGAFACGAVLARGAGRMTFDRVELGRLVIWGSGAATPLPAIRGGWQWQLASTASDDPQAPLADLQLRMRSAEGRLAESVAGGQTLVVADGPLNFAFRRERLIVGYVKRHQRAYLPPEQHARVPALRGGERSSLFRIGAERFSCYLRLCDEPFGGPWAGVVRLEFYASFGLEAARRSADALAWSLPRYAGLLHCDPRAPQNLQPIGALENYLRRHLGSEAMAERAVRESVHAVPPQQRVSA